jgi:hypothetical protein
MLGKFARGMVLVILATLIVVSVLSGDKHEAAPPLPSDQIIGWMSA